MNKQYLAGLEDGVPHTLSIVNAVNGENINTVNALGYFNGADKIIWNPMEGKPGKYRAQIIASKYHGNTIRNNIALGNLAENTYEYNVKDLNDPEDSLDKAPEYYKLKVNLF